MTVRPVSFVLMMKVYQKPRGLIPKNNIKPNCPYCRAKSPPHMLEKLLDRPKKHIRSIQMAASQKKKLFKKPSLKILNL